MSLIKQHKLTIEKFKRDRICRPSLFAEQRTLRGEIRTADSVGEPLSLGAWGPAACGVHFEKCW